MKETSNMKNVKGKNLKKTTWSSQKKDRIFYTYETRQESYIKRKTAGNTLSNEKENLQVLEMKVN